MRRDVWVALQRSVASASYRRGEIACRCAPGLEAGAKLIIEAIPEDISLSKQELRVGPSVLSLFRRNGAWIVGEPDYSRDEPWNFPRHPHSSLTSLIMWQQAWWTKALEVSPQFLCLYDLVTVSKSCLDPYSTLSLSRRPPKSLGHTGWFAETTLDLDGPETLLDLSAHHFLSFQPSAAGLLVLPFGYSFRIRGEEITQVRGPDTAVMYSRAFP